MVGAEAGDNNYMNYNNNNNNNSSNNNNNKGKAPWKLGDGWLELMQGTGRAWEAPSDTSIAALVYMTMMMMTMIIMMMMMLMVVMMMMLMAQFPIAIFSVRDCHVFQFHNLVTIAVMKDYGLP